MYRVRFYQDYGSPTNIELTAIASLVSLEGFDAFRYSIPSPRSGLLSYQGKSSFNHKPFSITLFVSGTTVAEYYDKISRIMGALRQFKRVGIDNRVVISYSSDVDLHSPVIVENVSFVRQTGLSALITITGVRKTAGLFFGSVSFPSRVTTTTDNLPKTLSFSYQHSFPVPLRIRLNGPINAGFQISRNEGIPLYDFSLVVGRNIPAGTSVDIDYIRNIINGDPPITNVQYLENPEVAPDIVVRPKSVTGVSTNQLTLSGQSSSGSITLWIHPMVWSIYE